MSEQQERGRRAGQLRHSAFPPYLSALLRLRQSWKQQASPSISGGPKASARPAHKYYLRLVDYLSGTTRNVSLYTLLAVGGLCFCFLPTPKC